LYVNFFRYFGILIVNNNPNIKSTIDAREVAQFNALQGEWWNPTGKMKPLHRINPIRLAYINEQIALNHHLNKTNPKPLSGLAILDIGCGGGLLCEPLARLGASVTGIDPGKGNIEIAKAHAANSGLDINYQTTTAEDLLTSGIQFDVVLAMEVIEHVANIPTFIEAIAGLVKPQGLFIGSTLNRTLRSFALAIIGAEYILRWLPKGTHSWDKFVTPQEFIEALEAHGFDRCETTGMSYSPFTDKWQQSKDISVNYFLSANKFGVIAS
jgi:2-polyprenyl-6-hydroxyphenyl methylase / 3-demethylubiquinone-9 3-methyltransferase